MRLRIPVFPARKAALTLVVLLASLLPFGGHTRASAATEEGTFVLYGTVYASSEGLLPLRVRAVIGTTVCGTGDVAPVSADRGSYSMIVVSADRKPGCGEPGATVRLHLIRGEVDPGVYVASLGWHPGAVQYDLTLIPGIALGRFRGELPEHGGDALLQWVGNSGVPIENAL